MSTSDNLNNNDNNGQAPAVAYGSANNNDGLDTSLARQNSLGLTPAADPFYPADISCFGYLKMTLVGLVLFLPRALLTLLIVLAMYFTALIGCGGCCDDLNEFGYPVLPKYRGCLRLIMRIWIRILLFVWGYIWIETEDKVQEARRDGEATPSILICSPHSGVVDSLVAFCYFGASFVGKEEALGKPIIGRIAASLQFIPVSRTDPNSRKNVADEITRRARWAHDPKSRALSDSGEWAPVALFPEATCTNGSAIIEMKRGAFNPMVRVTAISIAFPTCCSTSCGGEHAWVGSVGVGGLLTRTFCQIVNRCKITYLGDIGPDLSSIRSSPNESPKKEDGAAAAAAASSCGAARPTDDNDTMEGSGNGTGGGGFKRAESVGMISSSSTDTMSEADRFAEKVRSMYARVLDKPLTAHSYDDVRLDYAAIAVFGNDYHISGKFATGKAKMNYQECKALLAKFAKFSHKDSKLTKKQFAEFLGMDPKSSKDMAIVELLMERYDVDNDGKIDFREILQTAAVQKLAQLRSAIAVATSQGGVAHGAMVRQKSEELLYSAYSSLFATFDADRDSFVSRKEFFDGVRRIAPSLDPIVIEAIFTEIDSGTADGLVSMEEFIAYSKTHESFLNFVCDVISKNDVATNI